MINALKIIWLYHLKKHNIFPISEIQKPRYNNEPLTNVDRLTTQREYTQFLDSKINAKNISNSKIKNEGLNMI